ncbi:MAG: hypothetical protein MK132_04950 [Lentisphaerales bacterium]|nr:hypothetical protein [Lentisphaerales bacterium]
MDSRLRSRLFSIKGHAFTVMDFLEALKFFKIYPEWHSRVLQSLLAEKTAKQQGLNLDASVVADSSKEFRYEYDLLNIEELKDWLSNYYLDESELEAFLVRRYWSESIKSDVVEAELDVPLFQVYTEIVLSGAFDSLKSSWIKRLICWFSAHEDLYTSQVELGAAYEGYLKEHFSNYDLSEWKKLCEKELQNCRLEVYRSTEEDFDKAESFGAFEGYLKDLPDSLTRYFDYLCPNVVEGPFKDEDGFLWIKLLGIDSVKNDEDVEEYAKELYAAEVWKTLTVKYIDG